jgi:hypothetical protein
MDARLVDLATLDADVRRADARLTRFFELLARDETREAARGFDPFDGVRHVAGKTTYDALRAREPAAYEVPLRDALLRWVYELLQARVGLDLLADEAEAVHRVDPALPKREPEEPGVARTYGEAWSRAIRAPEPHRAMDALARAADLAAPVAAVRRERRARRFEAAKRLGLSHPMALAQRDDPAALAAGARALLDATEPLASDLFASARKRCEGPWRATHGFALALALDARDGWPARLVPRWLEDVFRAIAPRPVALSTLPEALGGASFLRAARAFGVALRVRGTPKSLPFALARDPYAAPAHLFGASLAIAVASAPFQRRALDLPQRLAAAQSRALVRSLFLALRAEATRLLLLAADGVDPGSFEELGVRTFGAPLPGALRDAWPAPRADAPARFVAAMRAFDFEADLVRRYDEDWYRNPRAGAHLASLAAGPAWDGDGIAEGEGEERDSRVKLTIARIARAFEERLG